MKSLGNRVALVILSTLFLASCFKPPEYSNTPVIEFESVSFVDVSNPSDPDSLILVVRFKDGDGDLGLDARDPNDTLYPYQSRTFFDTIRSSNAGFYFPFKDFTFITYKSYRTDRYGWKPKLKYDTLPPFAKPYNCVNWDILTIDNKVDTFYFERNPDHFNINVDYLVQQNDGTFKEFDWTKEFAFPQCGITFDGRFPVLSKDLSRASALDGKIRYSMVSTGFLILFSTKPLKMRVTILDRKLNVSNTVTTEPFTLQQIKKTG